ncbi:GTP cyclohydrolase I FolE [Streptococcus pyogenes]|uniref:GTP cyclohydrolase 1 n=1 Tax=Streptococcus pyogenes TaxID=1314 RepID=A0A4U7G4L9_STRPY|nr:GTP cyclohydrolase [Streptococcus pyogenes M1 GAS]ABF37922.1 GTP cyclohydrolase I [Streptococcus pyogenes MGAS10750]AGQ27589.1 GTP cyclohydrolase I [Streptococcus pyogenes HSC5]AMH04060.2 GTP cyclohydrolase I FolE [Streptococcus pyogenes]BAM30207.2 GTP cyclohydrolase I [Streptococcus pyogenes M1 476]
MKRKKLMKRERLMSINKEKAEAAIYQFLEAIGENPNREGLLDTPKRVAKMYAEMFLGLGKDPKEEFTAVFKEQHEDVVIVKDISFYSICEHHLVPFYGKAHIAYLPSDGRVTGLSKLARAVEVASKRPQLQERLTSQIADALVEALNPKGTLVMVEAEHMCMTMRGIKKPGSKTITTTARGLYKESRAERQEVISLMTKD